MGREKGGHRGTEKARQTCTKHRHHTPQALCHLHFYSQPLLLLSSWRHTPFVTSLRASGVRSYFRLFTKHICFSEGKARKCNVSELHEPLGK